MRVRHHQDTGMLMLLVWAVVGLRLSFFDCFAAGSLNSDCCSAAEPAALPKANNYVYPNSKLERICFIIFIENHFLNEKLTNIPC